MKRRTFLKAVGGSAVTSQAVISTADAKDTLTDAAGIPQRTLGKSGKKVSIVCFPGWLSGTTNKRKVQKDYTGPWTMASPISTSPQPMGRTACAKSGWGSA